MSGGDFLKKGGVERFPRLDLQAMSPSIVAHRETTQKMSVWSFPPPPCSWVLRSGNSRSFSDIEFKKDKLDFDQP